ncbi:MAG: hypothetical protein AAFW00_19665 [Bacteroidota bacterium]
MLNLNARLKEIPKNRYDSLVEKWEVLEMFNTKKYARQRLYLVVSDKTRVLAIEALFFCNELGLTIQELFNPEHSIKETIEKSQTGNVEKIAANYKMTG